MLIVDDDESIRAQMRWAFCRDCEVIEAGERKKAIEAAASARPGVAIIDLGLPPSPDDASEGLLTIEEALAIGPLLNAIVVTGIDGKDNAHRAIELGISRQYLSRLVTRYKIKVK